MAAPSGSGLIVLKSMLVALDGIADHHAAVESALFLAGRHGAAVQILLTLDLARIEQPEAYGVGSAARHEHLEETLAHRLRASLERIRPEIEQRLAATGINGQVTSFEGDVEEQLTLEVQKHDLLVLSSALRRRRDEDAVELDYALRVQDLIERVPAPIMLADRESLRAGGTIMVAYDASPGAARALHALLNLGLAEGTTLRVVSVGSDEASARKTAEVGVSLAARYGIAAEAQVHGATGDIGEAVLAEVAALRPSLLVMGAYGQRTWREWLFGSTTAALLDRVECPILVSH